MDDRKRALVLGKFKFMFQEECDELETLDRFQLAVVQNKLLGPVQYTDKGDKSDEEDCAEGEGLSNPPLDIPGVLDYFVVAWTNPFGQITIDQDIKLFEFQDIQKYSSYNEGPKSKAYCQFHSSSTSTELDGFDASIFWSAGILWKHFKTCGVERWDIEFRELVTHYRNWKEWAHEVHNLPDDKKDKTGKFSNNKFSMPVSTSTGYRRSKKRDASESPPPKASSIDEPRSKKKSRSDRNEKSSSRKKTGSDASSSNKVSVDTSAPPPTMIPVGGQASILSGGGQAINIPVLGTNGQTIQVQLLMQPGGGLVALTGASGPLVNLPLTPSTPGGNAQSMYSFAATPNPGAIHVNPAVIQPGQQMLMPGGQPVVMPLTGRPNLSMPPPNITSSSSMSSWTHAVNDFLTKKPTPVKKTRQLITCKPTSDSSADSKQKKNVKKYKPKAQVEAPSVEDQYNKLLKSNSSGDKAHIGTIKNWHGKFGFLKCDAIEDKIFLHSKDIKVGRELVEEGRRAVFQVLHFKKSVVGAKAVNVTVLKD